ncbi:MAG: hypothetical protein H8E12_04005 [Rhodobacteraceae bacterium]|nr:hypothetical protein [Paracoccaceae bacterium]
MTIISVREASPLPGGAAETEERCKQAVTIMTKHGARAWAARVIAGDRSGAGALDVYGAYPAFSDGAKSFQAFSADPDMVALRKKAQTDQVADMRGPWVGRLIFGEPASAPRPISVHRDYQMARSNMPAVMELAPQLNKLMGSKDVDVAIGQVIHGEDHEMMRVIYRFLSIDHWGETLDHMSANEEFISLVMKADELGTLKKSRVLQTI